MTGRRVMTMWLPIEVRSVNRYEWERGTSVSTIHEHLQTLGTGLEPVTKQATVRYLYHSATAAREGKKIVEDEDHRPCMCGQDVMSRQVVGR
ncbi:hypothetical protein TNCV_4775981 [Trichonephila clavipes]|nr:hypothetical protein TNCV_4775981 [Trichonephila clavipes]